MNEIEGLSEEIPVVRFEGFYRSEEQSHVRFVDGKRKEEEYFLYYKFLPEGVWICRTAESAELDMNRFLRTVDMDRIMVEPDHDEPMDDKSELSYQCGRYETGPGWVRLTWKNSRLDEKERSWKFYRTEPDWLETEFAVFGLGYLEA